MGNLLLRGSEPLAVYRGATQIESAYLGSTFLRPQGGGGGDAPYAAKAVRFDGSTVNLKQLNTAILSAPQGIFAGWFKFDTTGSGAYFFATLSGTQSDPDAMNGGGEFFGVYSNDPSPGDGMSCWLEIAIGGGFYVDPDPPTPINLNGVWRHVLLIWDTSDIDNRIFHYVIHGTLVGTIVNDSFGGSSNNVIWGTSNTSRPDEHAHIYFPIPLDAPSEFPAQNAFDCADVQIWTSTYISPSAENIAKFISGGKPVNPALAATAFGQQTILFSGDNTTFGTNQGTGGAFTQTGSLSNASTSPSD